MWARGGESKILLRMTMIESVLFIIPFFGIEYSTNFIGVSISLLFGNFRHKSFGFLYGNSAEFHGLNEINRISSLNIILSIELMVNLLS